MKKVTISLKRIEVTQFQPAKGAAQISLWFNHTTPHMLQWWIQPGDKQQYVNTILNQVKRFVKDFHPNEFHGDEVEDILAGHCVVLFKDPEHAEEKLGAFLGKLIDQLKTFRNATSSDGYLNKVASFEKMGMDF